MAKETKFPVRMQVDLTEIQAERIRDFRAKFDCASDSETIRELLTALFDMLDKDPEKDS